MAMLWRATGLFATLAAVATAHAQPIVSPRQVTGPTQATPAAAAKPTAPAKPTAKPAAPAKPTAPGKPTASRKPAAASKSAKSSKPLPAKPARSKPAQPAPAKRPAGSKSSARLVAPNQRGARADNLPRGFAWPPTPAMQVAGAACEAQLAGLGVGWKPAATEGHIAAPIELTDPVIAGIKYTSKWRRPPYTLDCQLARALAEAGPALYALGVREVRWGSMFRWSNVRTQGQELPFLSRHALGLAMDIVELIDDTGRVANVEQHYTQGDPLLLAVEQALNASHRFRIVLSPKNDPLSHHDHFHVEADSDYTAR